MISLKKPDTGLTRMPPADGFAYQVQLEALLRVATNWRDTHPTVKDDTLDSMIAHLDVAAADARLIAERPAH